MINSNAISMYDNYFLAIIPTIIKMVVDTNFLERDINSAIKAADTIAHKMVRQRYARINQSVVVNDNIDYKQ